MGNIHRNIGLIRGMLFGEGDSVSAELMSEKYRNQLRKKVIVLLKECYPENTTERVIFYNEAFKCGIAFFDSELLMLNLFFEKDGFQILASLYRRKAFDRIRREHLSGLTKEYINFVDSRLEFFEFREEDERDFIHMFFESIVTNLIPKDWQDDHLYGNPLVYKFTEWLSTKLQNSELDDATMAFLCFTKIWNSVPDFSKSFNNQTAILFYKQINEYLSAQMLNYSVDNYIDFNAKILGIFGDLFVHIGYIPLLDDIDSVHYKSGYLKRRLENQQLLKEAIELESISITWSYFKILNIVTEDTPDYVVKKCLNIILSKIKDFNFPSNDEVKHIIGFDLNPKRENLRQALFNKLYIYDT